MEFSVYHKLSGSIGNLNMPNLKRVSFWTGAANNICGNTKDLSSFNFPLLQAIWLSRTQVSGDVSDITASSLQAVDWIGSNLVYGDITVLINNTNISWFYMPSCPNLTGDIANLRNNTKLTGLIVNNT